MEMTITIYQNELEDLFYDLEEKILDQSRYYASDLIQKLELSEDYFYEALEKAETALNSLNYPIKYHIKYVFRATEEGIIIDLKLSPTAVYFISIHLDPSNPLVAKLQLYFAPKNGF